VWVERGDKEIIKPVIVPRTIVPFLSSIVTVSPVSFIKNLVVGVLDCSYLANIIATIRSVGVMVDKVC